MLFDGILLFGEHCFFAVKNSGKYKNKYTRINDVHSDGNQYTGKVCFKRENSGHAKHAVVNRNEEHAKLL